MTLLVTECTFKQAWDRSGFRAGLPRPALPGGGQGGRVTPPRQQGLPLPARHPPSEDRSSPAICRYNSFDLAFNSLQKEKKGLWTLTDAVLFLETVFFF